MYTRNLSIFKGVKWNVFPLVHFFLINMLHEGMFLFLKKIVTVQVSGWTECRDTQFYFPLSWKIFNGNNKINNFSLPAAYKYAQETPKFINLNDFYKRKPFLRFLLKVYLVQVSTVRNLLAGLKLFPALQITMIRNERKNGADDRSLGTNSPSFFFYILLIFIVCFNKDDKQRITLTIMCIFTILYKKKHEKTKQKDKQGEDK